VARRAVRHPSWVAEYLRTALHQRGEHRHELTDEHAAPHAAGAEAALRRVLDLDAGGFAAVAGAPRGGDPDRGGRGGWNDATAELRNVVAVCVRALRPEVMVETGVAHGYTSAAALGAMSDVGRGRLFSIDLPGIRRDGVPDEEIGSAVPGEARDRWELRLGPSRRLLAPLLRELGEIEVFLHDSDHTYASQLWEYRTAWPFIRPGGLLISDDVQNTAFLEFCEGAGVEPVLTGGVGPWMASPIGLARKRPA
jgi:predicted O-methyltransferase YrrM